MELTKELMITLDSCLNDDNKFFDLNKDYIKEKFKAVFLIDNIESNIEFKKDVVKNFFLKIIGIKNSNRDIFNFYFNLLLKLFDNNPNKLVSCLLFILLNSFSKNQLLDCIKVITNYDIEILIFSKFLNLLFMTSNFNDIFNNNNIIYNFVSNYLNTVNMKFNNWSNANKIFLLNSLIKIWNEVEINNFINIFSQEELYILRDGKNDKFFKFMEFILNFTFNFIFSSFNINLYCDLINDILKYIYYILPRVLESSKNRRYIFIDSYYLTFLIKYVNNFNEKIIEIKNALPEEKFVDIFITWNLIINKIIIKYKYNSDNLINIMLDNHSSFLINPKIIKVFKEENNDNDLYLKLISFNFCKHNNNNFYKLKFLFLDLLMNLIKNDDINNFYIFNNLNKIILENNRNKNIIYIIIKFI